MGLLTDVPPDKQPPGSLIQSNCISHINGYVEKAPGAFTWNATPTAAGIVAAHFWVPNINAIQDVRFIAADAQGNLYKGQNGVFGTAVNATIASVLTPNCVFAEGGAEDAGNPRKLFFFTGGATLPYVLTQDATAFHTIAGPASDWTANGNITAYPKFGLIHRQQLWAFAGQISYASSSTNHEDFSNSTTNIVLPVYPGEGGEVRGAFVFKGRQFCFKDGGFVYSLNDSDTDETNWYWQKVGTNLGLSAPNGIDEANDDMMVSNTYGTITSFGATFSLGNVEAADIIQQQAFETYLHDNTSKAGLPYTHMKYYAFRKQLFMTLRSTYSTQNDSLLMVDFARQTPRSSIWTKGSPQCLAKYKDMYQLDRLMYGDANGFLQLMDYEDRLEGTSSYTGIFQIPHVDFSYLDSSLSSAEKQFDFIALHYQPTINATILCDYFIDGAYIDTISFQLSQFTSPQLDTIQGDVNRGGQDNEETCLRKIYGSGRTLSAKFYQAGSNQSFKVSGITIYFRGGGDKAQQRTGGE